MSTHAVNQFETHALHAVTDPAPIKAFGEVTGCGPSAMARTLFHTVLDLHPLETSLTEIEQVLPEPAPEPLTPAGEAAPQPPTGEEPEDEELPLLVRWLHTYPESWAPDTVHKALEDLAQSAAGMVYDVEQRVVRRAVAHLQQLSACLSPVLDERQVALALLAATELLQHPVTDSDRSTKNQPVGSVVCRHLSRAIFDTEDDPAKE